MIISVWWWAATARATVGYNVPGCPPPLVDLPDDLSSLAPDLVVVDVHFFSVNYASHSPENAFAGTPCTYFINCKVVNLDKISLNSFANNHS